MILLWLFLAAIISHFLFKLFFTGRRESRLPPGPPTLPIFGNLFSYPKEHAHIRYTEWARQYGDIFSLKLVNDTLIVISSAARVKDILDVRSVACSGRPASYAMETITDGLALGWVSHDTEVWRCGRKAMQPLLAPHGSAKLVPLQESELTRLLHDLLHNPEEFYTHIYRTALSAMLSAVYGKRSQTYDSRIVQDIQEYTRLCFRLVVPGAIPPVELLPFLKWVPERWARWKTLCKEARRMQRTLFFGLLDECEQAMRNGQDVGYMRDVLERQHELGFSSRDMLGYHGGHLLDGGTDSTATFIRSFVLCMVAYPECQKNAWEELDRVVGDSRLPVLEDLASLPYIQAIIHEIHRFRPVVPVNLPHVTTAEFEYDGYIIPKNSTILMNTWAILHDPEYFAEPEEFRPERFLATPHGTKLGVDASHYRSTLPFGAGRRLCPGYVLANNFAALATMHLLWAFEFAKKHDPLTSEPVDVDIWNYDSGLSSMPLPFSCKITPRSLAKATLVEEKYSAAFPDYA